jgi:hypothetical protein
MRDTTKFQPFFVQAKSCISDAYDLLEHKVLGQGTITSLNKTKTVMFICANTSVFLNVYIYRERCCAHRLALVMQL